MMIPSFSSTKVCANPSGLGWAPPARINLNHIKPLCRLKADYTRLKKQHFVIEHQAIFLERQLLQFKADMPVSIRCRQKTWRHCHYFTNKHPELINAPNSPPHSPLTASEPYEPDDNVVVPLLSPFPSSASPAHSPSKPDTPFPTSADNHNHADKEEHIWHSAFVRLSRAFQSVCLQLAQLELELALVELRLDIRYTDRENNPRMSEAHRRVSRCGLPVDARYI